MYLTVCQQLKHLSKDEFLILRELCRTAKNLTNQAIYQVRQHYFEHSRYLPYEKNYAILKTSENYRLLNSNMAQQILKEVDGSFKSFFGLLKLAKQGKYPFSSCRLPKYLPKDGYATLIVGFVRLNGNRFVLPYSAAYKKHHKPVTITIPPVLADKTIKEIRIIPKADARFFEIQYTYQVEAAHRTQQRIRSIINRSPLPSRRSWQIKPLRRSVSFQKQTPGSLRSSTPIRWKRLREI